MLSKNVGGRLGPSPAGRGGQGSAEGWGFPQLPRPQTGRLCLCEQFRVPEDVPERLGRLRNVQILSDSFPNPPTSVPVGSPTPSLPPATSACAEMTWPREGGAEGRPSCSQLPRAARPGGGLPDFRARSAAPHGVASGKCLNLPGPHFPASTVGRKTVLPWGGGLW